MKVLLVTYQDGGIYVESIKRNLQKEGVKVDQLIISSLFSNRKGKMDKAIGFFESLFYLRKTALQFDIVHFHPGHWFFYFYVLALSGCETLKVTSVWGSDFLKISGYRKWILYRFYKACSRVTIANEGVLEQIVIESKIPSSHFELIRFGLDNLEKIDIYRSFDKTQFKVNMGLSLDKRIVCIGYNASSNQNHLRIIEQLKTLSPEILDLFYFVVPLAYGMDSVDYRDQVIDGFNSLSQNIKFIKSFPENEIWCKYLLCFDIFVNLQSTDMLSGTMQEALYAGTDVITGAWLPYEILHRYSLKIYYIEKFTELSNSLITINIAPVCESDKRINKESIYQLSGTQIVTEKLLRFYSQLIRYV